MRYEKVPGILEHIQREIEARKKPGFFILISSEKIAPGNTQCIYRENRNAHPTALLTLRS